MRTKKSRTVVFPVLFFIIGSLASTGASAAALEEIVVTAQKVTQNIQDVPIAITSFSGDQLQTKGLTDITRLSALTPNVNLDGGSPFSGDSSVLSASIRGIGQDDFAFNLDPGVGVYLDGVYLARTIGANQNLLDVERIEIAKGPQGTLSGRNTIGGAINIVTHTPGEEFKVSGQATLGNYDRRDVQVMADIPLSKNILSTISVSSQQTDGWQKIVPYPSDSSIGQNAFKVMGQADMPKAPGTHGSALSGGKDVQALRGKILFHATDNLDVTWAGDYTNQDQSGLPNTVMGVFGTNQNTYLDPNSPEAGLLFAGSLMGNFYNMCITTPAAALTAGPFNSTNGLCGPLGVGTWNSTTNRFRGNGFTGGVPALAGNGAVGVPNSVLRDLVTTYGGTQNANGTFSLPGGGVVTLGAAGDKHGGSVIYPGQTPRLYWDFANTQTGNKDTTFSNGPSFATYDAWGTSLTFDWQLNDDMKLKSITGYRGILWDVGTDLDGMPESIQEVTDEQKQWQVSQELQLTGKMMDGRLDYAAGLYYFTEEGYVHDFVPFDTAYLWIYDYKNDVHTDSYAAYLHVDYQISDAWGVTAGFRYSREEKDFEGGQGDLNGFSYKISGCLDPASSYVPFFGPIPGVPASVTCQQLLGFPDPANPLRYFPAVVDHQKWDDFSPTAGVQYHFNQDLMAYFSYSEGFKSGGWTTRLSQPILDASAARFDPEYDTTYEVGIKSQWFDNRLRVNVAGFYSEYDGIQINVQQGPSPVYQNAGDAEIKGVELEMQSVFENGFGLDFNAGYMDAKYTRLEACLLYLADANGVCAPANGSAYDPNFGGFIDGVTELPKSPEYKFTVSPSYTTQLANGSSLLFVLDYTHTGHMQNTAPNTPLLRRPATDMLNVSGHWISASSQYELAMGATNLTDDRYLTVGSTNPAAGEIVGSYNAPRMFYGSVRVNWD